MTDFILMVDKTSHMFITGPDVIKTVTGEDVTFEELGGARTHNTKSGVAHFLADDDRDCLELTRALLSYLPSNNLDDAPAYDERGPRQPRAGRPSSTRSSRTRPTSPTTSRLSSSTSSTTASSSRCRRCSRPTSSCGFARVDGRSIGVVANQPMSFAGTLDIDASEKAARFVRTCDAFNIPILTFVDVPGFLPGTAQEWNGIIRRGAKLLYAYAEATVPKVTVITRKAYGGAYDVMGSKHVRADINLAWPTAEIAVMGAQGAANILYRRELAELRIRRRGARSSSTTTRSTSRTPTSPPNVATSTRSSRRRRPAHEVIRALRLLRTKRESLPPKKHGNIPL